MTLVLQEVARLRSALAEAEQREAFREVAGQALSLREGRASSVLNGVAVAILSPGPT